MGTRKGAAIVTGAARRIGRAIALDLAAAGHPVAIHCNASIDDAKALESEIRSGGGEAAVIRADLANITEAERIVRHAEAALGPVTVLVNNASMFEPDSAAALGPDLFERQLRVNLTVPCLLASELAGRLPFDRTGVVVNIVDQRVWRLTPLFFSYTLAKSALWTATQTMAQAFAPRIRVAAIGPGPTLANTRQKPEDFARQAGAVPLGHGPTLAEIVSAVRFILATESFTGQMLALDGGQHLAWETPDALVAE